MKNFFFLFIFLFHMIASLRAQSKKSLPQSLDRPRLVVGIVVDQMRWDFLYRYYDRYGPGGFRRMLNEGFSCENTLINYLPSYTAVGHATIYTGSVPSIHGIVGNEWIDQKSGRQLYCTDDTLVKTIGAFTNAGKMSPRNLLTTTITDELRLATNFKSRVVGISLKDRAAILPAGHTATAAYWLDDASGKFISSSYYLKELPAWVKGFNQKDLVKDYMRHSWELLFAKDTYRQSTPDSVAWEGLWVDEAAPVFPHNMQRAYSKSPASFRTTPFGNTLILDFAKAAIEGYQLGAEGTTDFLTINCASTDYIGHLYGPNSVEIEDAYLRLDHDLDAFFVYLDKKIGKGKYLAFLTADHGAAHSVGFMQQYNIPSGFLHLSKMISALNTELKNRFGLDGLVRSGLNFHLHFNNQAIISHQLNYDSIKRVAIDFVQKQPGMHLAIDMDMVAAAVPEEVKRMMVNGYHHKRCGPIKIIPEPGWLDGYEKGTTHGSWNAYDIHIPLLFMGWRIGHGSSNGVVNISDIAPTIAALLRIQMPNGCIGKPIEAVVNSGKK